MCRSSRGGGPELLNSDAEPYGGSGQGNFGGVSSQAAPWHGLPQSLVMTLPPLGIAMFKAPASDPFSRNVS